MKIVYHENPLATQIFLDDQEKEIFKLKLKVKELEDFIYHYYFSVSDKHPTLNDNERAAKNLEAWIKHQDENEDSAPHLYQYYIDELESGVHFGDCTCVASSCCKCHAEFILGFHTTDGLHKHMGSQVQGAFNKVKTLDEAIALLHNPITSDQADGEDKSWYTPELLARWNKDRVKTVEWLINYQASNLGKEVTP